MATISFFIGFEVKDKEQAVKVLEALSDKGVSVTLTEEEKALLRKQEAAGKKFLEELPDLLERL